MMIIDIVTRIHLNLDFKSERCTSKSLIFTYCGHGKKKKRNIHNQLKIILHAVLEILLQKLIVLSYSNNEFLKNYNNTFIVYTFF